MKSLTSLVSGLDIFIFYFLPEPSPRCCDPTAWGFESLKEAVFRRGRRKLCQGVDAVGRGRWAPLPAHPALTLLSAHVPGSRLTTH